MTNMQEMERETVENAIAFLVGARKRLELVSLRCEQAERQLPSLMSPAMMDLEEVKRKIGKAQTELTIMWNKHAWQE